MTRQLLNRGTVRAGDSIGFTIWVNNTGAGTAYGVTLHDPLPTGTGVSWSTSSAGCAVVSDVLDCSFGDLASGTGASAHVTSPTTFDSCAAWAIPTGLDDASRPRRRRPR